MVARTSSYRRSSLLRMSSSSATQDTVDALTANIKAKGDEIRRYHAVVCQNVRSASSWYIQ